MTQQQLADFVHVSSRTIISIGKQYSPSLMLAYRMAEVFGISVEELYCLRENRELEDKQYKNLQQETAKTKINKRRERYTMSRLQAVSIFLEE